MRSCQDAAATGCRAGACAGYGVDLGRRQRPGEQKALHLVAAGQPQQHPLLVGFDPFRLHLHAERMPERDDRLDDGAGIAGGAERGHEGAIDLEPAERKFLQITQTRIAGTEIIERDADTERAQCFEADPGFLRIIDEDAFGNFEHDARRGDAGLGHDGLDELNDLRVADLHR